MKYLTGLRALLFCNILKLCIHSKHFPHCLRALLFCNILKPICGYLFVYVRLRALLFCNILKLNNNS